VSLWQGTRLSLGFLRVELVREPAEQTTDLGEQSLAADVALPRFTLTAHPRDVVEAGMSCLEVSGWGARTC
jgi:hypothetical protein